MYRRNLSSGTSGISQVEAAGANLAQATQAPRGNLYITDAHSSSGVKLSDDTALGEKVTVFNGDQGSSVKIYPPTGSQKFGVSGTPGDYFSINANVVKTFMRIDSTTWVQISSASAT